MKVLVVFVFFFILLFYLMKRTAVPKLSLPLFVPLAWMILSFSRDFSQWLNFRTNWGGMEAELEGNKLDAAILALLILSALRILHKRKVSVSEVFRNNKALFLFYGLAVLSFFWADFPFIAFKRWMRWFGSLLIVLVIVSEYDYKSAIRSLIKRCAYLLIPLSIIFIRYLPQMGRSYNQRGRADYHGVATQKNEYGMLLMMAGIYMVWELIVAWKNRDRTTLNRIKYVNIIFLAVILWQIIFINAKTSLICLIGGSLILIFFNTPLVKKRPRMTAYYLIGLALTLLLLQHLVDIKGTVIGAVGRNQTLTGRTELWTDVLAVPINPVIGSGWDSFWLGRKIMPLWEKWVWRPRSAHSGYIEIYLYLGWAGIVLLSMTLLAALKKCLSLLVTDFDHGCLALTMFFVVLLNNYSESAFHRMSPIWICFLLFCSLTLSPQREFANEFSASPERAPTLA